MHRSKEDMTVAIKVAEAVVVAIDAIKIEVLTIKDAMTDVTARRTT